ncbi:hypothetical protein HCG51_34845 (plasmid) [Tolypothrix sp. PCC 7910]|uniref:hypothetical protein n=1 Tax=Tolypothrix sp. PCC 7910 TaxID=2099387 RepID=UPI001427856B|nr:hypothetical protein [Tolypothrix sp. PCC 7910]QIR41857.1 hypothetical protein HCG51_34845 [Tolypothrix sp. PCC 7910]
MKQKSHQSAYATKIKKLVETAKELRTENFRLALPITRLTSIKSLCQDEVAAEQFALYMSKRVQQQINDGDYASHKSTEEWEQNKNLIADAITQMEYYLETPSANGKQSLCQLLRQIDELQGDDYRNVSWTTVHFVKSGELLKLEYAIRCFVEQDFPYYAYKLAREFIEGYKPQYGTGLIPESETMLLEVAEFWCQYYFGQNLSQKFPKLIISA